MGFSVSAAPECEPESAVYEEVINYAFLKLFGLAASIDARLETQNASRHCSASTFHETW
jgi:hypothetical protein